MDRPKERDRLREWLAWADTLLLMNGQFDVTYLRALNDFRFVLDGRHFLIDLSIVNYLENEVRPERSLKTIGPVLRTHVYERTAAEKFEDPADPDLHDYNRQDTHNTMAAIGELAKRIVRRWGADHDKLSPYCLQHYSDLMWSCIRISESGIPMSITRLAELETKLTAQLNIAKAQAEAKFNLLLEGEGSQKSKNTFINLVLDTIDGVPTCPSDPVAKSAPASTMSIFPQETGPTSTCVSAPPAPTPTLISPTAQSVRNNPLLQLTKKTKAISFSEENRNLLSGLLAKDHPLQEALDLWKQHTSAQKLLGSYVVPLLRHRKNDPEDQSSRLLPQPGGGIGLAFPSIFIIPSQFKDGAGDEGGQQQGRISFKGPSAQTFPPAIKDCEASRFGDAGVIVSMDFAQIEPRAGTLLSGEASLIKLFKEGGDLHTNNTIAIYGPDIVKHPAFKNGDRREDPRQWGKTLGLADWYLASAKRMQLSILELSGKLERMDFFQEIERSRRTKRPQLWEWQLQMAELAERDGHLVLPFTGVSRAFVGFKIDRARLARDGIVRGVGREQKDLISEIVNFPVQYTAGTVTLRLQHYCHKHLPGLNHLDPSCLMFLNCYDSLTFDCRRSYLDTLLEIIKNGVQWVEFQDYWAKLCDRYGRYVPLKYEVKIHESRGRAA